METKVLIADDDSVIRLILRKMLARIAPGWIVEEAADGDATLDLYFSLRPDIILMDVNIPVLDGWDMLDCIREIDEKTKVIMVTSEQSPTDVTRAMELGASGFVGKPFDEKDLAGALGLESPPRPKFQEKGTVQVPLRCRKESTSRRGGRLSVLRSSVQFSA